MKGQMFTIDVLASLILVTILLGLASLSFEQSYLTGSSLGYNELRSVADDWCNILVKRSLVVDQDGSPLFNVINTADSQKFDAAIVMMKDSFGSAYSAEVSAGSSTSSINSGCAGKADVAVSSRAVFNKATNKAEFVSVKVCLS